MGKEEEQIHVYVYIYINLNVEIWVAELDHKEGWAPNNLFFQTVVLEKTLESLLDGKEIKSQTSQS